MRAVEDDTLNSFHAREWREGDGDALAFDYMKTNASDDTVHNAVAGRSSVFFIYSHSKYSERTEWVHRLQCTAQVNVGESDK